MRARPLKTLISISILLCVLVGYVACSSGGGEKGETENQDPISAPPSDQAANTDAPPALESPNTENVASAPTPDGFVAGTTDAAIPAMDAAVPKKKPKKRHSKAVVASSTEATPPSNPVSAESKPAAVTPPPQPVAAVTPPIPPAPRVVPPPTVTRERAPATADTVETDDSASFFSQNRWMVIGAVVALAGGGFAFSVMRNRNV